ncbi:helix-turn-helix transcriptional regulator [Singulisphaera sp. PoT]|uniref:helix-turn-helix transcriptional regulator n=1 Tax=Singulisphaera sp. PoT TaxID=3411797 RepID=UPI003BF5DEA5
MMEKLGEKVLRQALKIRYSRQKLAEEIEMNPSQFGRALNGKARLSVIQMFKLAKLFGVTMEYLVDDDIPVDEEDEQPEVRHSMPSREADHDSFDIDKLVIWEMAKTIGVHEAKRRLMDPPTVKSIKSLISDKLVVSIDIEYENNINDPNVFFTLVNGEILALHGTDAIAIISAIDGPLRKETQEYVSRSRKIDMNKIDVYSDDPDMQSIRKALGLPGRRSKEDSPPGTSKRKSDPEQSGKDERK